MPSLILRPTQLVNLLVAALFTLAAMAQTVPRKLVDGKRAFDDGDLAAAIKIVKPLAESGDAEAQEYMGEICSDPILEVRAKHSHLPVPCGEAQAVRWYRLAADRRNAKAQCRLGVALWLAKGIPQNDSEAFKWMLMSAAQGYPDCMCNVGSFYRGGWGGARQDHEEALKWYETAMKTTRACEFDLGLMHFMGWGTDQNYKIAAELLRRSADRGERTDAALFLGFLYRDGGHGIEKDSPEAAKWFKKVIDAPAYSRPDDQTLAKAQRYLGRMYASGEGVPQDYAEAMKLFSQAVLKGDAEARALIGNLYDEGKGVPQDYQEAVKWYRESADQGDDGGQTMIGLHYRDGKGVPQDYVLAHMWLNLAAANGNIPAGSLRDLLAHDMTPAQIAEAQRLAREWKPKKPTTKK